MNKTKNNKEKLQFPKQKDYLHIRPAYIHLGSRKWMEKTKIVGSKQWPFTMIRKSTSVVGASCKSKTTTDRAKWQPFNGLVQAAICTWMQVKFEKSTIYTQTTSNFLRKVNNLPGKLRWKIFNLKIDTSKIIHRNTLASHKDPCISPKCNQRTKKGMHKSINKNTNQN